MAVVEAIEIAKNMIVREMHTHNITRGIVNSRIHALFEH